MEGPRRKSVIITGASGGMGSAATEEMARRGWRVIMACRNLEKADAVRRRILGAVPSAQLEIQELHLDSFASIRDFAARMRKEAPLDALFNNAGTLPRRYSRTVEGYEQTLGVNYLGPWLLTRLMLPSLGDDAGIVNMVSISAKAAAVDRDFFKKGEKDFHQLRTYADTKLALIYFSIAMAQKSGRRVNMADPGIVDTEMIRLGRWFDPLTDIFFRPFCNSPARGARPAVNALCSECNMQLFSGNGRRDIPQRLIDRREDIEWLWNETANDWHGLRIPCCEPPHLSLRTLGKVVAVLMRYCAETGRRAKLAELFSFIETTVRRPADLWPEFWYHHAPGPEDSPYFRDLFAHFSGIWVPFTEDPAGDHTVDSGNCEQCSVYLAHFSNEIIGFRGDWRRVEVAPFLAGYGSFEVRNRSLGVRDEVEVHGSFRLDDGKLEFSADAPVEEIVLAAGGVRETFRHTAAAWIYF